VKVHFLCLIFSLAIGQRATAITFDAGGSLVGSDEPGSFFSFYASVSGLGGFQSPSLSAYNIVLAYDPNFLSIQYAQIGDRYRFNSQGSRFADISTLGLIRWSETSTETPVGLSYRQPSSFDLMDYHFTPLRAGFTRIDVISADFYDQDRNLIDGVRVLGADIAIEHVPESGPTAALLLIATTFLLTLKSPRLRDWQARKPVVAPSG
jgi:hypothetical protein